jgi:protein ImuB
MLACVALPIMRTYVRMIACLLIPRFELTVAVGGAAGLAGRPLAIAPQISIAPIGEVSGAAEAFGVRKGMALGEALARCPQLELASADPIAVASAWEQALRALEGIGAAVEPAQPGQAYFALDGLRGIHGGSDELVLAATRRALERPARLAAAPTRFCALAAARAARGRRALIVRTSARDYLAGASVALLEAREQTAPLVVTLERLGIATLGQLAALPRRTVVDRFGLPGVEAHRLACGEDDPPRPRLPTEPLRERFELPESASGLALENALGLLIDRLLARPERRGRTLRAATLSARLAEGGSWQSSVTFREPLADPARMRLALAPRLALLPSPAEELELCGERFGTSCGDQRALFDRPAQRRRARLREAVGQLRVAAGADAALRVCWGEIASRVPERRAILTPFDP